MVKFGIHFLFLVFGIAYLARRSQRFYWQALGVFAAGMVVNAFYGVLQLLAARSGSNLDNAVLSPLTGGESAINIYGAVQGKNVYRPNALTGDPNHLGIMLLVEFATLSRSGLAGLVVGALILAFPYRRKLTGKDLLAPLAGVAAILLVIVLSRLDYFEEVLRS